jgi:hypothetical protein
MKNFEDYFQVNESLDSELRDKLSQDYRSLKRGLLNLIEDTVDEPEKLLNVQNYMNDYIENDDVVLEEFVEENDIYEFYLKYQSDVDSILSDEDYFDKSPAELSVYSLYEYVVEGTKEAVKLCMKEMYDEIFGIE